MSKGSGGATTADSVSNRGGVAFNAERAARHARRLQKASSQGATQSQNPSNAVDEVHKVFINNRNEDVIAGN